MDSIQAGSSFSPLKADPRLGSTLTEGPSSELGVVFSQDPVQARSLREYMHKVSADLKRVDNMGDGVPPSAAPVPPPYSQPSSEEKRARIMEQIDERPQARANWQALSPQEQGQFLSLAEEMWRPGALGSLKSEAGGSSSTAASGGNGVTHLGGGIGGIIGGLLRPGTDLNLLRLLENGALSDRDRDRNSLLDNLSRLKDQKFAEGLNGAEILRQIVESVANPDAINQGTKGSCAVTTVEYLHAKERPADYVRVMAGLTGEDGKASLRNGEIMHREDGSTLPDNSGRRAVDRIYQDSMREYANGARDYDNQTDEHYEVYMDKDGNLVRKSTGKGTPMDDYERAMDAVLPYDSEWTTRGVGAEAELRQLLQQGYPVQVVLSWGENSSHALALEGMDAGQVFLRNPWGDGDVGQGGDNVPERTVGPGGHIAMSKNDFFSRLLQYSRPVAEAQIGGKARPSPINTPKGGMSLK